MDASLHKRAEQLATGFASQARTAEDLNGVMRLMMKSVLERMLHTEMDVHLGRQPSSLTAVTELTPEELPPCGEPALANEASPRKDLRNRRNGKSPKTVQGGRSYRNCMAWRFPPRSSRRSRLTWMQK